LSERFAGKWETRIDKRPIATRIREAVRPPAQLKPRLGEAVKRITIQIQKLDKTTDRFSERDKT